MQTEGRTCPLCANRRQRLPLRLHCQLCGQKVELAHCVQIEGKACPLHVCPLLYGHKAEVACCMQTESIVCPLQVCSLLYRQQKLPTVSRHEAFATPVNVRLQKMAKNSLSTYGVYCVDQGI